MGLHAQLFNVTQFVVSQVNPHVVPFVHANTAASGSTKGRFGDFERFFQDNAFACLQSMARSQYMPLLNGENLSGLIHQRYHGDVTITPFMHLTDYLDGTKAIRNPSAAAMQEYLLSGQRSTWPHVPHLQVMLIVEQTLKQLSMQLAGAPLKPPVGTTSHLVRVHSPPLLSDLDRLDDAGLTQHHHVAAASLLLCESCFRVAARTVQPQPPVFACAACQSHTSSHPLKDVGPLFQAIRSGAASTLLG